MKDIGRLIAKLRKERQMSQEELAERLGCTKQTISNYERNIRRPDYEMLEAIADALNVPMGFFLSKEEQQRELDEIYKTYKTPASETSRDGAGDKSPSRKALDNEDFDTILREPDSELRRRIREHRELREKAKAVSSPRFTHSIETTRLAQSLIEQLGLKDATESSGVSFSQSYGSSISSDSTRSSGLSREAQLVGEQYDSLDDYGKKAVEAILAIEMSRVQGMRVMAEDGKLVFEFSDPTGMFSGRR